MAQKRQWLINFRNEKKLTQQNVADYTDLNRSFYSQIENGDRNPSVHTAKKIGNALNFDWTIFFVNISGDKQQETA